VVNVCYLPYLTLGSHRLPLSQLTQIKVFPEATRARTFKLRLSHSSGVYFLGAELKRELYFLPDHYIWLAKLINARLAAEGTAIPR
jgi:hypothetical protein